MVPRWRERKEELYELCVSNGTSGNLHKPYSPCTVRDKIMDLGLRVNHHTLHAYI